MIRVISLFQRVKLRERIMNQRLKKNPSLKRPRVMMSLKKVNCKTSSSYTYCCPYFNVPIRSFETLPKAVVRPRHVSTLSIIYIVEQHCSMYIYLQLTCPFELLEMYDRSFLFCLCIWFDCFCYHSVLFTQHS